MDRILLFRTSKQCPQKKGHLNHVTNYLLGVLIQCQDYPRRNSKSLNFHCIWRCCGRLGRSLRYGVTTKSNKSSLFSTSGEPSVNIKDLRALTSVGFIGTTWHQTPSCTTPQQPTIYTHLDFILVQLVQQICFGY